MYTRFKSTIWLGGLYCCLAAFQVWWMHSHWEFMSYSWWPYLSICKSMLFDCALLSLLYHLKPDKTNYVIKLVLAALVLPSIFFFSHHLVERFVTSNAEFNP